MASFHPDNPSSSSVLHSSMYLPDDIWTSGTWLRVKLNNASRLLSISKDDDSGPYSLLDDIDTTSEASEKQQDTPSMSSKQECFQDQGNPFPTCRKPKLLSSFKKKHCDVPSLRATINKLEEQQSPFSSARSFMQLRGTAGLQPENQVHLHGDSSDHNDNSLTDLNSFRRLATDSTKKFLKKIKTAKLVKSPRNLMKKRYATAAEGAFTESLSSAGPSSTYNLPRDMSPISNKSRSGSCVTNDADTPFSNGLRSVENHWRQNEKEHGYEALRRKVSDAKKYVQKWKGPSKVGGFMRRSLSRNDDGNTRCDESDWNSTSARARSSASPRN